MSMQRSASAEEQLLELLASLENRPYDFVMAAFPWGEPMTELEHRKGPDPWQEEVLRDLQEDLLAGVGYAAGVNAAIAKIAIKSGHNVGKSALLAWIGWWAFSTRVDTKGRATANTEKQLRTVLWAELGKWHGLFIAKQFFRVTATAIYSTDPNHALTWRFDAVPWSADNPDAFSGLHNYGKRIIILFDEASGIDDAIWERTDGVMREAATQLIWVVASNPTRSLGRFYDCFNKFLGAWRTYTVSSLDVSFTNKAELTAAIEQWGPDDDYTRVRILGEFPNSSLLQLIPQETIAIARSRPSVTNVFDPLILAVDIARFGNNESVAQFRRGRDARSLPVERWRGLTTVESGHRIAAMIGQHAPDAVFIDEGGVGGGVVDFIRILGHTVIGVNFGAKPTVRPGGVLVGNKRAEMYIALRDWLREGGQIPDSTELEDQLMSIEYKFDKKQQILLQSKEDMRFLNKLSPDWADALAMSFAYPVAGRAYRRTPQHKREYDPLGVDALNWGGTRQQSEHVH